MTGSMIIDCDRKLRLLFLESIFSWGYYLQLFMFLKIDAELLKMYILLCLWNMMTNFTMFKTSLLKLCILKQKGLSLC